jgi:uncharacterized protein (TIGR03435 family)
MLGHLSDVSLRSMAVALVAAIGLWAIGRRRSAALEHAVWTVVVCGMLAMLAGGWAVPRIPLRVGPATIQGGRVEAVVVDRRPLMTHEGTVAAKPAPIPFDWTRVAASVYSAIAMALFLRFAIGMWLVRRMISSAQPMHPGVWESQRIAVPVTVGWFGPRVILPPRWRAWPSEKLDAVLAHEGAHARRRDGLVAAIAAVNRCVFWFHPLAWILERRLALLAEQACDEYSVAVLGDRDRYARLLIEMASVVDASTGRLRGHALTMAAASHIRQRVDALLREGRTFSRGLSRGGWAAVAACAVPLVFGAGALEVDQQASPAQEIVATAPKFEVAAIKRCANQDSGGKSARGGRGGGGRGVNASPGRLSANCMTLKDLIQGSYVTNQDDAPVNTQPFDEGLVRGGPSWVYSDRYSIQAETDDPVAKGPTDGRGLPATKLMTGPMLRGLLAERFRLKIHREVEEIPMYALTVAKGGFKLKPMEAGACREIDTTKGLSMEEMRAPGQKPLCVNHVGLNGPNLTLDAAGSTMHRFALGLGGMILGRPVVDKTGISGEYVFHLEFLRDDTTDRLHPPPDYPGADADVPAAPSIFAEVEKKMGLKLTADKGPRGYLVIDSVERPSEN